MRSTRDFQNITSELISAFAVLDGFCDSPDVGREAMMKDFFTANSAWINRFSVVAGESITLLQDSPLRVILRDHLYLLLCLLDNSALIHRTGEDLYNEMIKYLHALRLLLREINAEYT
jgi:hypothetical protein